MRSNDRTIPKFTIKGFSCYHRIMCWTTIMLKSHGFRSSKLKSSSNIVNSFSRSVPVNFTIQVAFNYVRTDNFTADDSTYSTLNISVICKWRYVGKQFISKVTQFSKIFPMKALMQSDMIRMKPVSSASCEKYLIAVIFIVCWHGAYKPQNCHLNVCTTNCSSTCFFFRCTHSLALCSLCKVWQHYQDTCQLPHEQKPLEFSLLQSCTRCW